MAGIDLATPANTTAKIRWREQYVSEGINKKLNGIIPAGVVRGGLLVASGAVLSVTVQADPNTGDSIYSYIDATGHQVTFYQSGDVTLSLNTGGIPGTTVFIGLEVIYAVSANTEVYWRAYSQAEVDADPTLIIVGRVDCPGAGVIPASDIYPDERRDAWTTIAPRMREWEQVVPDGGFESFQTGTIPSPVPIPGWEKIGATTVVNWTIVTLPVYAGTQCMEAQGLASGSSQSQMMVQGMYKVSPGRLVDVSFWCYGQLWTGVGAGDTQGVQLDWFDDDYTLLIGSTKIQDISLSGDFPWTNIREIVAAPANAAYVRISLTIRNTVGGPVSGSFSFDDVRVWIEKGNVRTGEQPRLDAGVAPAELLRKLLIGQSSMSTTPSKAYLLDNLIALLNNGVVSVHNEAEFKHVNESRTLWKFTESLLELTGALSSPYEAQFARLKAPFISDADRYTLMYEFDNDGGTGRANIRIYAASAALLSGNGVAFSIVHNAAYDPLLNAGAGGWHRDVFASAARLDFMTGGEMFIYEYTQVNPDDWLDSAWASGGLGFDWLKLEKHSTDGWSSMELAGAMRTFGGFTFPGSYYGFDADIEGNILIIPASCFTVSFDQFAPKERDFFPSGGMLVADDDSANAYFSLNRLPDGAEIDEMRLWAYQNGPDSINSTFRLSLKRMEYVDGGGAPTENSITSITTGTTSLGGVEKEAKATGMGIVVEKNGLSPWTRMNGYFLQLRGPTAWNLMIAAQAWGVMLRYTYDRHWV